MPAGCPGGLGRPGTRQPVAADEEEHVMLTRTEDIDRSDPRTRAWLHEAVRLVEAAANRSADTHLISLRLSAFPDVDLYLKDESTRLTGSLKDRLARSLFLYALCNGRVTEGTTIVEASKSPARAAASSRCSATAASGTRTATSTTTGARRQRSA
jgi:hypothetical protein